MLRSTTNVSNDEASLVRLENIVKDYRNMRALDGVHLAIQPGITGLLGPNGAGKSTLIKVILGLVKTTSGTGTVLGYRLGRQGRAIRNKVGYMPEDDCYIPGMSGVEVVQFSACLSGLPIVEALRRAHEILDFSGMKQERYRSIETFSTGMRQKIKFASAIVHDPEYLILDEPTAGLDPEERETLLNRIRILATQSGKSVLISTHILPDVQAICDHAVILANGKVRLSESLQILNRPTAPTITLGVMGNPTQLINGLNRNGMRATVQQDGRLLVSGDSTDLAQHIWHEARQCRMTIQSMTPARNSLEEIFVTVVKESADGQT